MVSFGVFVQVAFETNKVTLVLMVGAHGFEPRT